MSFVGAIHEVMHATTRSILDGLVQDVADSNEDEELSEVASKLRVANWSYGVKRYNFSKVD